MPIERSQADFGARMRRAREARGVSLRQIADSTKLSVGALEALERNEISRLPGGIFSRAFVRSYATEIGMDPETTVQEFMMQFPHESVTAGNRHFDTVLDATESDVRRKAGLVAMACVAVLLAASALIYFFPGR